MNTNYNLKTDNLLNFKLLLTGIILMSLSMLKAQNIRDSSFLVSATVNPTNHSIQLNWMIQGAKSYQIHRKELNSTNWGSPMANVTVSTYTDFSAVVGVSYDYRIMKLRGNNVFQMGYVSAGIQLPLVDFRNSILLVVDSTTSNGLSAGEKSQWMNDYIADGYIVEMILVSPTAKAPAIKAKIKAWYDKSPATNRFCLLMGKITVPYSGLQITDGSGNLNPDAHTEHGGAWPTDSYYADIDGEWTDDYTMVTGVGRVANQNSPGDGKFDQHVIPSDIDIQIGRVDMRNLPAQGLTEIQLIKQYLRKLHQYKAGIVKARDKAFISDNFGLLGSEMPMRSGWNNASALVGASNIVASGNYMDSTKANSYIFSDMIGAGSYTTCAPSYNSSQYKDSILSVFNVQFGSYFGDWDNSDNFLRSCIAGKGFTLTTCWAARPHWYFQHMALGLPIGYSALLSQNNTTDLSFVSGFIGTYWGSYLDRRISMTLLGDPTLRMKYYDMPKNLVVTNVNSNTDVKLDWQASSEAGILGYHVYRATSIDGFYFRITPQAVTGLIYTDTDPYAGSNFYLVKPVKLEISNTASYYNTGIGAMGTANGVSGTNTGINSVAANSFKLYPNPATGLVYIESENITSIEVMNMTGQVIYNEITVGSKHEINTGNWAKGIYLVKVNTAEGQSAQKLVVE